MKKIKNFSEFLNENFIDHSFFSKIGSLVTGAKNREMASSSTTTETTPKVSTSTSSEVPKASISSEIVNSNKYSDFTTDPLQNAKLLEPLSFGPYKWKGTSGMPIDIYFKGNQPIFRKTPDGSTYCTGYTFSVAFVTCLNRGLLNDFTDADIRKMQIVWNSGDPKSYPKLCVDAISKPISPALKSLGEEVTIDEVQPGDFCQLWRTSGSGHSVIVMEIVEKNGKKVGIKYYSSNGTINKETKRTGPGENTEHFSDSGGTVLRKNTYYARLNQLNQS